MVEHHVRNVGVESSNLFFSTNFMEALKRLSPNPGRAAFFVDMKRYLVKYIEREGGARDSHVLARNKSDARRIASERGCEDIIEVRRVGYPIGTILFVALIIGLIVFVAVS